MRGRKDSRTPTRRVGRPAAWIVGGAVVAALLAPVVLVVALAPHHHPKTENLALWSAIGIALATLLVTIYPLIRKSKDLSLTEVADQLAASVRDQWKEEARRLNDPYPLPLSWVPADSSLTDNWNDLVTLATRSAGWPAPPAVQEWATGPADLTEGEKRLVDVLTLIPTGRLVVLGDPGTGKTLLMVQLVLDLLARRASGETVPVLLSMASWNPMHQDLHKWLGAQLIIDHPALAATGPSGARGSTRIQELLDADLILPVLDGLDEIADAVRDRAILRINKALPLGGKVIVTCRAEEYMEAVRPSKGIEVKLRGAAAIQLSPLKPEDVRAYLSYDAGGAASLARWDPVLAALGTNEPVGQVLTTPLMIGLARLIYNQRYSEHTERLPNPAKLCELPNATAVRNHLLDGFIPACYQDSDGSASKRKVARAERHLSFVARHLEFTIGNPNFAWWELRRAIRPAFPRLIFGMLFGLLFGSLILLVNGGWIAAFFVGSLVALLIGLRLRQVSSPSQGIRFNIRSVRGLGIGLLIGLGLPGLAAGLALSFWLKGAPSNLTKATTPRTVLARDRRTAIFLLVTLPWFIGLVTGLILWLIIGLMYLLTRVPTPNPVPHFHLPGIPIIVLGVAIIAVPTFGLGFALWLCLVETAWPSYLLTRVLLALTCRAPWRLMGFLSDARDRGVLRQAGAVYQFRHIELQRRLASQRIVRRLSAPSTRDSCTLVELSSFGQTKLTQGDRQLGSVTLDALPIVLTLC